MAGSRKRKTPSRKSVKKGGKIKVVNQQLVSKVSHKNRPVKQTDQIEGDAPLDAPSNPLPGNKRPNKRMGVLADELTSNLHLTH